MTEQVVKNREKSEKLRDIIKMRKVKFYLKMARAHVVLTPKGNTFILTTPNTINPIATARICSQHVSILTPGGFTHLSKVETPLL